MKEASRVKMAMLIVQARHAWKETPKENEPEVIKTAKLPMKEIEELYEWAKQAMSAMEHDDCGDDMKKAGVVKLAETVDLNSTAERRAGSTPVPGTNRNLSSMMQLAVPLWIEGMKAKGGPDDEDRKKSQETSGILGERGDILLFGGGKKGEAADQFNRTAHAVAVLAFCPGGVDIFGSHFEA